MTKDKRGLGLRKEKSKTLALLTSTAWRFLNSPTAPWANILTQIFVNNNRKSKHSYTWNSTLKGWHICNKGSLWAIHSNSSLSIWSARWIPNTPLLRRCIEGPLNIKNHEIKISDPIVNNTWSFDKLSFTLPPTSLITSPTFLYPLIAIMITFSGNPILMDPSPRLHATL